MFESRPFARSEATILPAMLRVMIRRTVVALKEPHPSIVSCKDKY